MALPAPGAAASPPFLWRVEGPTPSYLFGTVHSADPTVKVIAPAVLNALDRCTSFHPEIELSPEMAGRMALRLFTATTPDLKTRLPLSLWERVKSAGAQLGLPEPLLQRLSPGFAALLFAVPFDETDIGATVDGQLYARSQSRGLAIVALETVDEQLDLFANLPPAQAQALLAESLDDFEAGHARLAKLLAAYASGEERNIAAEIEKEFKNSSVRELADPLLYRRNTGMSARAEAYLRRGGAFVAVGVAHLVGPRSMIALLRSRGFKITRVKP
jgi:uncharacterized protein YbaP (TraB family)